MYIKILLNSILIFIVVVLQFSFFNGLPLFLNKMNFILIVLLFIIVLGNFNIALWFAIGSGLLFDIYSFSIFGVYLILIPFSVFITNYLIENFFTNRSLYSFLAVIFFSTIFHGVFVVFIRFIYEIFTGKIIFFMFSKEFLMDISMQIIVNLIIVIILFYIFNIISHRLKPIFLWKR